MRSKQVKINSSVSSQYLNELTAANTLPALRRVLHRWRDFTWNSEHLVADWGDAEFAAWRQLLAYERNRKRNDPSPVAEGLIEQEFYDIAAKVLLPDALAVLRVERLNKREAEGSIFFRKLREGALRNVNGRIVVA